MVPSSFRFDDGAAGELYLYAATNRSNFRVGAQPRAQFTIDVTPMRLRLAETRQSLTEFLTHTVAVLGGIFVVAGLIDGAIFHTSALVTKKSI